MSETFRNIHVFLTGQEAGIAAGKAVEERLVALQRQRDVIRIIFAAAPSQDHLLAYLASSTRIQWEKIIAFSMDEYLELPDDAPQLFSRYLENNLFSKVALKEIHTIDTQRPVAEEITRFTALINAGTIDIVCLGIGENGHVAFNDPPVADFEDPQTIKQVDLDLTCRMQQVHDGCFSSLEEVPATALTLTIPALLRGESLFCVVVGNHKKEAVKQTLTGPIDPSCPASILQTRPDCQYYFDRDAFGAINLDDIQPQETNFNSN